MCLAVPMKLIEKDAWQGLAELGGVKRQVNLMLVPHAKVGDYVVVHAGGAIEVLDEAEAKKTIEIFQEMCDTNLQSIN